MTFVGPTVIPFHGTSGLGIDERGPRGLQARVMPPKLVSESLAHRGDAPLLKMPGCSATWIPERKPLNLG